MMPTILRVLCIPLVLPYPCHAVRLSPYSDANRRNGCLCPRSIHRVVTDRAGQRLSRMEPGLCGAAPACPRPHKGACGCAGSRSDRRIRAALTERDRQRRRARARLKAYVQSEEYARSRNAAAMPVGHGPYPVDRVNGGLHSIGVLSEVKGAGEDDYRRRVRGLPARTAVDDLHGELRAAEAAGGRVAAVRALRRRVPGLSPTAGNPGARPPLTPIPNARGEQPVSTSGGTHRSREMVCAPGFLAALRVR